MSEWTKERLTNDCGHEGYIYARCIPIGRMHNGDHKKWLPGKRFLNDEIADANARRVVQCWNACLGIPDPQALREERDALAKRVEELTELFYGVREHRNKLLWSCKKALTAYDAAYGDGKSSWSGKDVDEMRAAVALETPTPRSE